MYSVIQKYITDRVSITDEQFEVVKNSFTPKKLRKKQYLLQEGDVCKYLAFVNKGALRLYKIDDKGNEHIVQFALENWWITDRESIVTGIPSEYNIDALEDSELLLITWKGLDELKNKIPPMKELMEKIQEKNFIAVQKRIHAAISYTAEEKYKDFISNYPNILQRVPQHMIASYLGMTPETLSRVRKNFSD